MNRTKQLFRSGQGAALPTSLIILVAIMLLGATTARLTVQAEKAARNERDFRTAFHAAEAALSDAQADIAGEGGGESLFLPPELSVFLPGCGRAGDGDSHGLCAPAAATHTPVWLSVDLLDTNEVTARTVAYGEATGRHFAATEGTLSSELPRYMIELLAPLSGTPPVDGQAAHAVYRITTVGFGMRPSTHVVLQAVYRRERVPNETRASEKDPLYRYRSRRLSWREIPHWQELRDASRKQ